MCISVYVLSYPPVGTVCRNSGLPGMRILILHLVSGTYRIPCKLVAWVGELCQCPPLVSYVSVPLVDLCGCLICPVSRIKEPSDVCPTPPWCQSMMCAFCSPFPRKAWSIVKRKSCEYPGLRGSNMLHFRRLPLGCHPEMSDGHLYRVPPQRRVLVGFSSLLC